MARMQIRIEIRRLMVTVVLLMRWEGGASSSGVLLAESVALVCLGVLVSGGSWE